jgi:hypothetical protein
MDGMEPCPWRKSGDLGLPYRNYDPKSDTPFAMLGVDLVGRGGCAHIRHFRIPLETLLALVAAQGLYGNRACEHGGFTQRNQRSKST